MKPLILALLGGLAGISLFVPHNGSHASETAYQRVMRTKTLRCGNFIEAPFTNQDANTGRRSGIVPEIVNRIAADYGLKVEWQTITNFALMGEDLKQGKYDAICASLINMPRNGLIDPVDPFAYVPMYVYVRQNETRLTSLGQLDADAFRIAAQDGTAVLDVAKAKFPHARLDVMSSANLSDMLNDVITGKADATFEIPTFYQQFIKTNPGTVKPLNDKEPLQTFLFAFGIKPEEEGLKSLLNQSLQRMTISGELAAIFAQYDPAHQLAYPVIQTSGTK